MFTLSNLPPASERLTYAIPSLSYLSLFHDYSQQKEIYTHLEFEPFLTVSDTRDYLHKLLDRIASGASDYRFLLDHNQTQILGLFGFHSYDSHRQSIEFGYGISPSHHGQGLFKEASSHMLRFLIDSTKIHRIYAITSVSNSASIAALKSVGFDLEGIMRDYYRFPDHYQNATLYSYLISR